MSCIGKTRYRSRSKAKEICKVIKSAGKGNLDKPCNSKLFPYQCKICGMWHLTSQGKLPGRETITQ